MQKIGTLLAIVLMTTHIQAAEVMGTLKKIKDTGIVTIGYRELSIPFSYLDDKQKPIGYTIDLCHHVIKDIKKTLEMQNLAVRLNPVTAQTRIPLVTNETVDIECGSTTNNLARQKQVDFSQIYFIAKVKILTKTDSAVHQLADLANKTVVLTTGTTADTYIKEYIEMTGSAIKRLYGKDHAESLAMLASGQAAAFVLDDILLAGLHSTMREPNAYTMLEDTLSVEHYSIMFRKGDKQLKALIYNTLARLVESGEAVQMYKKWFHSPIQPYQVNLQWPMDNALPARLSPAGTSL